MVQRTLPEGLHIPVRNGGADVLRAVVGRNAEEDVPWVSSFVSEDKTRTFCISDAPSPKAIRKTAASNELPVDRIGRVSVLDRTSTRKEQANMFNHHLIKRSLAAAAVIATAGFPSAAQATFRAGGGGSSGPVPAAPRVAPQPVATSGSSFQWSDAEIGAAGATVLLGAGALGTGMTRRRRRIAVS